MVKKTLTAFLVILLVCGLAGAKGKTDIGFKGLGVRVGYVMPEDPIDATFGFGLQAQLGQIIPEIKVEGMLDYWSKSYDTGFNSTDASFSAIAIGFLGKYYFDVKGSKILPYTGAGLAVHFEKAKVSTPFGDVSDTQTDLGVHFVGGIEYPFSSSWNGVAELKYALSDANYFGIYAGMIYKFGK
jgi:hypothetical protein